MRVVLDTNVVVSGVFFGGLPGRIMSAWAAGEFDLVLSPPILDEYRRVGRELQDHYPGLRGTFDPVLAVIATNALLVDAPPLPVQVGADASDDMFLAAALASNARVIVSGDKGLVRVSGWRGITVLTPRQFVEQHVARG